MHAPCHSCRRQVRFMSGDEGVELHSVAKVSPAFDPASFLLVVGTAADVFAAKVVIHYQAERALEQRHGIDGSR